MTRATSERPQAGEGLAGIGAPVVVGHHRIAALSVPVDRAVTHSHAALTYITKGHSRVELNGHFTARPGDVLLVPAGAPHRALERKNSAAWMLGFCVSCLTAHGAGALLAPFERVRDGASAVISIPKERRPWLESLFRELVAASEQQAAQHALLTLILSEIDRAASPQRPAQAGGVVVDALRFIERSAFSKLTARDVARAVRRTPTYVTSALKAATGRNVTEWITASRMAEARRLLLHSDERVDVIGERVGYADSTHFIRTFRRAHGATPAAWRSAASLRVR
ncbi:MAG: AraC family transcriptional regulator [Myxococcaceae bacterium]